MIDGRKITFTRLRSGCSVVFGDVHGGDAEASGFVGCGSAARYRADGGHGKVAGAAEVVALGEVDAGVDQAVGASRLTAAAAVTSSTPGIQQVASATVFMIEDAWSSTPATDPQKPPLDCARAAAAAWAAASSAACWSAMAALYSCAASHSRPWVTA
jgi:hypothetical protein